MDLEGILYKENVTNKTDISIMTPTLMGGGAEKVAVNLANHYANIGFNVDLVVFTRLAQYQSLISNKVTLINLNASRTSYAFFKVRGYLKKNKTALILSVICNSNVIVGLASFGLKLKSITFREANTLDGFINRGKVRWFIQKTLMKISYTKANNVIANSDDTKYDLIKNEICKSEKIRVIRNPVLAPDFEELKLDEPKEEWFSQPENKVILSVGRLDVQKNHSFLIASFKDIYQKSPNARLVIVGDGNEKDNLLSLISKNGLSEVVKLVPFQRNIYPYYYNSDVFALSSDWEGFGNVLVEALSVGLPIVSTNCPGGPKMILKGGEYGALTPLGDKKSYVSALLKILEKPEKNKKSIVYAKIFTVESVAKDYLKILKGKST